MIPRFRCCSYSVNNFTSSLLHPRALRRGKDKRLSDGISLRAHSTEWLGGISGKHMDTTRSRTLTRYSVISDTSLVLSRASLSLDTPFALWPFSHPSSRPLTVHLILSLVFYPGIIMSFCSLLLLMASFWRATDLIPFYSCYTRELHTHTHTHIHTRVMRTKRCRLAKKCM